jgi:hypothetical protein
MITGRAVSALLLHHHRRVVMRRAVNYDFAGALGFGHRDMLLFDSGNSTRYEVEIQLGATNDCQAKQRHQAWLFPEASAIIAVSADGSDVES